MNKREFFDSLKTRLSDLPENEINERINFYGEMIDDRIEEGYSEEEAVLAVGSADDVALQIRSDISSSRVEDEKMKKEGKKELRVWQIVLLIIGAPLWIPLVIAAVAVILALYAVLWSLIVSAWAVFGTFAGCLLGGVGSGIILMCTNNLPIGLAMMSAGFVCGGLAIFAFFGCLAATKGSARFSKKIVIGIVNIFRKKEGAR